MERAESRRSSREAKKSGPERPSKAAPDAGVTDQQQLLSLQRSAGNAAVVRHLGAQAKLQVGATNDPLEREADVVADLVVHRLAGRGDPSDPTTTPSDEGLVGRVIRRRPMPSATIGHEGGEVDAGIASTIDRARGSGSPLPGEVRRTMEGAFGADFSDVRVHADDRAGALSRQLNAEAFTTGSDIFFRGPAPDVGSSGGQRLLAHELAHTVQQGASGVARSIRRDASETAESETEQSESGDALGKVPETAESETEESETEDGPVGEVVAEGQLGTIEFADGAGEGRTGPAPDLRADDSPTTSVGVRTGTVSVRRGSDGAGSALGQRHDEIYSRTPRVRNRPAGNGLRTTPFGEMAWGMTFDSAYWRVTRLRRDNYELYIDFDIRATSSWGTNSGGATDIPSGTAPAVTAATYAAIATDLTPVLRDSSWVPPRVNYWSSAISERHERYHADEYHDWMTNQGASVAKRYLMARRLRLRQSDIDDPSNRSLEDYVEDLLDDARQSVRDAYNLFFEAGRSYYNYPGEVRAYLDGKVPYETLAAAVTTEGQRLAALPGPMLP